MDARTLIALTTGIVAVLAVQGWFFWRLLRALTTVQRLDEKLGHFGDALSLLTETTESGFRAVALELDRTPQAGPGGAVKKTSAQSALARASGARINAAARRGRSVSEIAAAEQLSEGEVRLRLHLAKQAAMSKTAPAAPAAAPAATSARRGRATRAAAAATTAASQEQVNGTVRA